MTKQLKNWLFSQEDLLKDYVILADTFAEAKMKLEEIAEEQDWDEAALESINDNECWMKDGVYVIQ